MGPNYTTLKTALVSASLTLAFGCTAIHQRNLADVDSSIEPSDSSSDVPTEFRPLYNELSRNLSEDLKKTAHQKQQPCPIMAPSLFQAMSSFGPYAQTSPQWKDLTTTLDRFRQMGMTAVSVMILTPDLSLGKNGPALISYYQSLREAVHTRGMKLYVESFVDPATSPFIASLRNDPDGKAKFFAQKKKDVTLIFEQIRPDFLSLLTEPETATSKKFTDLNISAEEFANWLSDVSKELKETDPANKTLLGAGPGVWESREYAPAFAAVKTLDYIDFHLYPIAMGSENQITQLEYSIHQVRTIAPEKQITIGETWLYKETAKDTAQKGAMDFAAYSRDIYSFWSPLDARFMDLLIALAQKNGISVVAPYFAQYYFVNYQYGSSEANAVPAFPLGPAATWAHAMESETQLTPVGKSLQQKLSECR